LKKNRVKYVAYEEFDNLLDKLKTEAENAKNWEISVFCQFAESALKRFRNNLPQENLSEIDQGILSDLYDTTKTYYTELCRDFIVNEKDNIKEVVPRNAVSTTENHVTIFGNPEKPRFATKVRQYVPHFYYNYED